MAALRTVLRRAPCTACECLSSTARVAARPLALRAAAAAAPTLTSRAAATQLARALTTSAVRLDVATKRSAWAADPIMTYEELKPITQQPTDNVLLIDVREPDEVALGSIPSAVNLPLSRLREALDPKFNPGDFQKEFAFSKPTNAQNIVFFCRSGKRSASASEWAGERGYANVRNYEGSWLDWSAREKQQENDD